MTKTYYELWRAEHYHEFDRAYNDGDEYETQADVLDDIRERVRLDPGASESSRFWVVEVTSKEAEVKISVDIKAEIA